MTISHTSEPKPAIQLPMPDVMQLDYNYVPPTIPVTMPDLMQTGYYYVTNAAHASQTRHKTCVLTHTAHALWAHTDVSCHETAMRIRCALIVVTIM